MNDSGVGDERATARVAPTFHVTSSQSTKTRPLLGGITLLNRGRAFAYPLPSVAFRGAGAGYCNWTVLMLLMVPRLPLAMGRMSHSVTAAGSNTGHSGSSNRPTQFAHLRLFV